MGIAQLAFVGERWGATGSHMTGSNVSHLTRSDRKYVLRMPGFSRAFFLTRVVEQNVIQ